MIRRVESQKSPDEIDCDIYSYHRMGWSVRRIAKATRTGFHRILDVIDAYGHGQTIMHVMGGP
jgi:hypothetical protein